MDTMIGKVIDNYKIMEVIGRGGMGVVFKAIDMNLEKTVALKMIDPFLAKDENFLKRFKTEAKALAKLDNRNIVNVYALRETGYGLFMVMEYVPARTISEWLREKNRFTVKETISVTDQILNAIHHAHEIGIIHRDIKPNNILLGENGEVKVMDFGLAKVAQDHSSQSTMTHAAAGTLYYMSPEQIKGLKNVDKRSDIYSIGMTIYEMLAGRTPFEKSDSEFAIQKQIVDGRIPSPLKFNPGIPRDLVKFIQKAIDKDAEKRFRDISEMQEALSGIRYYDDNDVTKVIDRNEQAADRNTGEHTDINKKVKLLIVVSAVIAAALFLSAYLFFFKPNKPSVTETDNQKKNQLSNNEIKFASLNILSEPAGAIVLMDGEESGKTPLFLDSLKIKNYSIMLSMEGYEDLSINNYKPAAGYNSINENLKKITPAVRSTLSLRMDVPGKIYIDGRSFSVGINEKLARNVTAGRHRIRFVNEKGISEETMIEVSENQKRDLYCYFKREVNVQSLNQQGDSFWGNIYVNGENTGIPTPGTITLEAGTYRISVRKTGYTTVENEVPLKIIPAFKIQEPLSLVFHLKTN